MDISVVSTILRALLKWWWLIVISIALGVGAGYFLRREQPDIYYARATTLVGQDPRAVTSGGAGFSGQSSLTLLEAYSIFARRASVLNPVIEDLNLGTIPEELSNRINLEINPGAALLEISVFDSDPERAAQIANRLAQELVNQSRANTTGQNQGFIESQLTDLENQITQLQDRLDQLLLEASTLTSAFEINQNRLERETLQATITDLRRDYAELNASIGNSPGLVQLFELATPNYYPIAASSAIDLVFAGVGGGILAILTVVLITFFDDRLQWEESDQETIQGAKILGPLGIIPRHKLPLYVDTMPNSIDMQAVRQVRDKIILASEPRPRVITFLSYDSGDGKTLTSANMGLTFAKAGMRTIVLDLDLRRGDLHEIFRLPNVYGISDVVAAKEPLEEILQEAILDSGYENLALMTSGRSNTDPAALLSRARFPQLIYLLKKQFDMIVMDSAPTIAGSDPIFLAEVSDGVVIVVSARRTTMTGLKRTLTSLREAQDVNILGVVFNRVRLQVTSKYSNSYYQQVPGVKSTRLSQELLNPKKGFSLRAGVIQNKAGERYYSVAACALRLGVKERTVREWCKTGYLKSQRRPFRRWIKESDIEELLKRLPHEISVVEAPVVEEPVSVPVPAAQPVVPATGVSTKELNRIPDQLREQREALLDFVKKPSQPDSESPNSNSQH
jgi:capsular exopolysaccharide synthesis family protein